MSTSGRNTRKPATSNDWRRVRELELFCDGVAVQTLIRIGAPPSSLIDASADNRHRFRRAERVGHGPDAETRIQASPSARVSAKS